MTQPSHVPRRLLDIRTRTGRRWAVGMIVLTVWVFITHPGATSADEQTAPAPSQAAAAPVAEPSANPEAPAPNAAPASPAPAEPVPAAAPSDAPKPADQPAPAPATPAPAPAPAASTPAPQAAAPAAASPPSIATKPATLDETRLTMGKWIETQQIISKERKEWQQGRDILTGRVELVKKEIATLEEKIKQAEDSVAQTNKTKDGLVTENEQSKAVGEQLTQTVTAMEAEVRRLFKSLPEPIQAKLRPLYARVPEDPAKAKVSTAERFQNILGILNEVNKANTEISVVYEVRNLSSGKPAEVQTIYVGLAQAYYVSPLGEAGVGHATPEGWKWEPSKTIGGDVLTALEIIQGKQTPAFVPLPVKFQ